MQIQTLFLTSHIDFYTAVKKRTHEYTVEGNIFLNDTKILCSSTAANNDIIHILQIHVI